MGQRAAGDPPTCQGDAPEKLRPPSTTSKSSLEHAGFPRVPDRGILYQSVINIQRFQGSWSWDSLTLVSESEIPTGFNNGNRSKNLHGSFASSRNLC